MLNLSFRDLVEKSPEQLTPEAYDLYRREGLSAFDIDSETTISNDAILGVIKKIGKGCTIGSQVILKDGVFLGSNVWLDSQTILERGVRITKGFVIGHRAYFAENASVERLGPVPVQHTYRRTLHENVTIGPNVTLPSEVQLGVYAVVPTTESVGQIGRFGTKKRMVTAYGSPEGPLYGVGCQYGISANIFRARISNSTGTSNESALDYFKHFEEIEALGMKVQTAYDLETALVEELLAQRHEAFASL